MQTEVDASKTDSGLVFTESAAKKVKTLIEDEKNPNLKLRVFITGAVSYTHLTLPTILLV